MLTNDIVSFEQPGPDFFRNTVKYTFGAMKICLTRGSIELMSVNHCARSGGIIGISFRFS